MISTSFPARAYRKSRDCSRLWGRKPEFCVSGTTSEPRAQEREDVADGVRRVVVEVRRGLTRDPGGEEVEDVLHVDPADAVEVGGAAGGGVADWAADNSEALEGSGAAGDGGDGTVGGSAAGPGEGEAGVRGADGADAEGVGAVGRIGDGAGGEVAAGTDGIDQVDLQDVRAGLAVESGDGCQALNAILPPAERRALVLIDPPYEVKSDYKTLIESVKTAHKKFATGVYLIWYPVLDRTVVLRPVAAAACPW